MLALCSKGRRSVGYSIDNQNFDILVNTIKSIAKKKDCSCSFVMNEFLAKTLPILKELDDKIVLDKPLDPEEIAKIGE